MKPGTTAVIFVSQRAAADPEGYEKAAREMGSAAEKFPGYCGIHMVRGADGIGITISYWANGEAARAWKADAAHTAIREQGRATWYEWYELIVADVTRGYSWRKE
jgi:heme-degrading monooxygenase HmoA